MKITDLTAKPTLAKITLDQEALVEKYGEPIDFWCWDRQPLEKYVAMAQNGNDMNTVLQVAKEMILDEEGAQVIQDGKTLPSDIAMAALTKVIETLGK